LVGD
jgi:hypothetical protein